MYGYDLIIWNDLDWLNSIFYILSKMHAVMQECANLVETKKLRLSYENTICLVCENLKDAFRINQRF